MVTESQLDEVEQRIATISMNLTQINGLFAAMNQKNIEVEAWQLASAEFGIISAKIDQACAEINTGLGLPNAKVRILAYLRGRIGQKVTKEELRGVAVIYEWARRVRELRVEHGWPIATQAQRPDLKPGEYVLESDQPDTQIAADWKLAKSIRAQKSSGKAKGLEYLQKISPRPADKEQLSYVMRIKSYARRLRELDEEGWQIHSNIDDRRLASGSYRMVSLERRSPRVRRAIKLRYQVLERDSFKCADDGKSPDNDRVTLQIHHIKPVSQGGDNSLENLITLCSDCHAGRHAISKTAVRDELLEPGWLDEVTEAARQLSN